MNIIAIIKRDNQGQWNTTDEVYLEGDEELTLLQAEQGLVAVIGSVCEADIQVIDALLKGLLVED